jgi:hypothetical protein
LVENKLVAGTQPAFWSFNTACNPHFPFQCGLYNTGQENSDFKGMDIKSVEVPLKIFLSDSEWEINNRKKYFCKLANNRKKYCIFASQI